MGHKADPVHGDLRAQIVSTTWTLGVAFLYISDIYDYNLNSITQNFQCRIDLQYESDGSIITLFV